MDAPRATWRLLTPTAAPAAIAIIEIHGEVDATITRLGMRPMDVGAARVHDILGFDRGLVVRWACDTLWLMPHGGPALVRLIGGELGRAGLARIEPAEYPEAPDDLTRWMLETLARARSPLAIDLLLDQPRRWSDRTRFGGCAPETLDRLVDPPLVVAVGAPNIGKSTLANALAGRAVSIVADAPGTTRDAVGVLIDFGGLVARYLDTPGLEPGRRPITDAQGIAESLARGADLVLRCGDASTPAPEAGLAPTSSPHLTIALRSDLGTPGWSRDVEVCARLGDGVEALAARIRESLVPAEDLADPRPWRFWENSVSTARIAT